MYTCLGVIEVLLVFLFLQNISHKFRISYILI